MRRALTALAALLLVLGAASAPAAHAARDQESIFQEDDFLLRAGDAGREHTLDELQSLGVDSVHTLVGWSAVAPSPTAKQRPHFDATDPAAYPAHSFDPYDGLVRSAQRRGMSVIFTVNGFAPIWASHCGGPVSRRRACKPDPRQYGRFVRMLGKRYSGTYRDENDGGEALPRVTRWSVWNEPNQSGWLAPQSVRHGHSTVPYAPYLYRRLVEFATSALRDTGHGGDQVLIGETAPLGRRFGSPYKRSLAPVDFLRETFCLDRHWRPYRGRAARLRHCQRRTRLAVSGIAHHPYTRAASRNPLARVGRHDITVDTLSRLRVTVDRAARRHVIAKRLPLYLTEHGFQTDPPDELAGTSLHNQAAWLNFSDWMAFRQPRVKGIAQYQLRDEPNLAGFQTGLRYHSGEPKPSLDAYRLPIWVTRSGAGTRVWGQARPVHGTREAIDVQYRDRGDDWRTAGTLWTTNARGFVMVRFTHRADYWRLVWHAKDGDVVSRIAKAHAD